MSPVCPQHCSSKNSEKETAEYLFLSCPKFTAKCHRHFCDSTGITVVFSDYQNLAKFLITSKNLCQSSPWYENSLMAHWNDDQHHNNISNNSHQYDGPVIAAKDNRLSTRWANGIGELMFILATVVKLLLNATIAAKRKHSFITTSRHERIRCPCQCIWWAYVLADFSLEIHITSLKYIKKIF